MTTDSLIEALEMHIVDYPTPENIVMQRHYINLLKGDASNRKDEEETGTTAHPTSASGISTSPTIIHHDAKDSACPSGFGSEISVVDDLRNYIMPLLTSLIGDEMDAIHFKKQAGFECNPIAHKLAQAIIARRKPEPVSGNPLENSLTGIYSWNKEANELRFIAPSLEYMGID